MSLPFCSFVENKQYEKRTKAAFEALREKDSEWFYDAWIAARSYKASNYIEINKFMLYKAMQRGYSPTIYPSNDPRTHDTHGALLLNQFILALPSVIKKPLRVYRGFSPRNQDFNRALHTVGNTVVQTMFWSTSCLPHVALSFGSRTDCCFLELQLPAKYPALYADALTGITFEMEFLLAPLDAKGRWRRWLVSKVSRRTIKYDSNLPPCYKKNTFREYLACDTPPELKTKTVDVITLQPY